MDHDMMFFRILFALYLPLMLAPVPAAAAKKSSHKPAAVSPNRRLESNYSDPALTCSLEIKVKSVAKGKKK
jgi:hypothetical protein